MSADLFAADEDVRSEGFSLVCGVDEVGRGPLAGPVVAAAVIFSRGARVEGINDSKKLARARREELIPEIRSAAAGVGIGMCDAAEIDKWNILRSSLVAMARAIEALKVKPDILLIDGNQSLDLALPQRTLVKGDSRSAAIAAASIIAKEYRDELMDRYALEYPQYGFDSNMGYPTRAHRDALAEIGPSPIHRKTFKGVREFFCESPTTGSLF